MTGKERILTALAHGQPDVVPLWELAFNEASILRLARYFVPEKQLPKEKFYFDMDEMELFQLFDAFKIMARELGLDGVNGVTNAPCARIDDQHIRDDFGIVYHCSEFGEPYPVQGPINGPEDLKNFTRRPQDADYLQIAFMRSQFPDKAVSFMMPGTFYMSWSHRGAMEKLLLDYALRPQFAHDLARATTDYCLESVEKAAKAGADFLVIECDLASGHSTLMSPAHYEEFVGRYYAEIVAAAHRNGMKIVKHSDGALKPLISYFIEEGFDALHPIQPQCMDIAEIKREFGDRLCLMGNIDCANLLVFGASDAVRESVRQTIATAAPGGGFIISSSNTIHPGCKPENYLALVEAARKYGRYPELTNI